MISRKRHYVAGVGITGVACAIPSRVVKNEGDHARAAKVVGVQERRFAETDSSLLDLGEAAAKRVMADLSWEPAAVDALVFVTQTNYRRMPSISCELHERLGLEHHVPAFDLNMACSGYVYGLWVAASLRRPRVLLVVGDTISRFLDPADASTYPIFGDAVSATFLEMSGGAGGIEFVGGTDGRGAESLRCYDRLHMDGQDVFQFALSTVPGLVADTTMNGYVDWYLFHQANDIMLRHIGKKANVPVEKMPMNIARYGNTSSASIPLLMVDSECTESLRERKNVLAMFGFGAGLSWGGVRTETDKITCSLEEI